MVVGIVRHGTSPDFREAVPQPVTARCAERLVLALDRLFKGQRDSKTDAQLNQLFKLAQSLPDFDPKQFADALEKFLESIKAASN